MEILYYTILLFGVAPTVLFFYKKAWKNWRSYASFLPLIFTFCLASFYEPIGTRVLKIPSNYWFNTYAYLEIGAITYLFYQLLYPKYQKLILVFFLLLLVTQTGIMLVDIHEPYLSDTATIILLEAILFGILTILWFKKMFHFQMVSSLWHSPDFYFVIGIFFYYWASCFYFLFIANILENEKLLLQDFMIINYIANLVMRTSILIGTWKALKKSPTSSG